VTYVKTLQGILYLAVVLDVFSRKIVGWQMADTMTTDLVLTAFEMGLWRRDVVRDRLIHHSDKGSQGGFNWSSQHLDGGGVHGQASGLDAGVDGQGADEVAGQAVAPA